MLSEVEKHSSNRSCWVIIQGNVYDLTTFLDVHPGGAAIILKYAGKDATAVYEPLHPSDAITKHLTPESKLGPLVQTPALSAQELVLKKVQPAAPLKKRFKLSAVVSIGDFERAANQNLAPQALAFIQAGADDEAAKRWNERSWRTVRFRPRVLRPVNNIDLSTSILGTRFSLPFFISPAGGGKLAHPQGEVLMTRAAARRNVLHWVCNMASCTQEEIASSRGPDQSIFWQIYAKTDLTASEHEIKLAIQRGFKGFALTVDAIRAGNRERDVRHGIEEFEEVSEGTADNSDDFTTPDGGISAIRAPVYSSFDWDSAISWLRSQTDLPIAIKGIQCWEDAAMCMKYNVHPWLSNHGGRQLDGAPSSLETLLEIRKNCPEILSRCDVIVDGGFNRGSDIVKALALGAKAVGIGRPFLFALSFGEAGISKAIGTFKKEIETTLALLGVETIAQLDPTYVDASSLQYSQALRALL
ncbi:hypothetical protein H2204_000630 [Knufia peltigerae]|uniref:Uncharacterized protein n=1 Tax=Knufia peltigerae TaxID=1002370 RepID=A0AA39D382_9EURO|nr:hypothetical protein H2204_000630 [Knufia peltigerae]